MSCEVLVADKMRCFLGETENGFTVRLWPRDVKQIMMNIVRANRDRPSHDC
jgi:hypothetical protein